MISRSKSLLPLFGRYYSTSILNNSIGSLIRSSSCDIINSDNSKSYYNKSIVCKNVSRNYIINHLHEEKSKFINRYYSSERGETKRGGEEEEGEVSYYDEDGEEEEDDIQNYFDDNEEDDDEYKEIWDPKYDKYVDMDIPEDHMDQLMTQTLYSELHELFLQYPLPLYKEIKYQIYKLHRADPTFWDIDRLATVFKLHPARVVALIKFVDLEEAERERGSRIFYEFEDEYEEAYGVRLDDSEMLDEQADRAKTKQKKVDQFAIEDQSTEHLHLGNKLKRYHPKLRSKAAGSKPDPIHEIPTQIPPNYPEKSVYFRGPTFVVPRKKNVVFVDTSRDKFTKKANPDPMVLIQGIDGSLRTPSSEEKVLILNKVKTKKVKRDPYTLLSKPFPVTKQPLNIEMEESFDIEDPDENEKPKEGEGQGEEQKAEN